MRKVYLMVNELGHYKLGYSKNPRRRVEGVQTGSSTKVTVVAECEVRHHTKVETTLHRKYKMYRMEGEWFALPPEVVDGFVEDVRKTDEIFEMLRDNPFI